MNAQDRGGAQSVVGEGAVEALQVFRLQPVEPVVSDARTKVEPDRAAVALQRSRTDPAGGDVVQPVVQPLTDRGWPAGCLDDARVTLGLDGTNLGYHICAPGPGDVASIALTVLLLAHRHEAVPPPVLVPVDRGFTAGALPVL
jgi:hypothetical protein